MSSLNNQDSVASLAHFIKSKTECEKVIILEDTSSCLSVGRNIYYCLREIYDINLPIKHIDLRSVGLSFSLKNQLRQHNLVDGLYSSGVLFLNLSLILSPCVGHSGI